MGWKSRELSRRRGRRISLRVAIARRRTVVVPGLRTVTGSAIATVGTITTCEVPLRRQRRTRITRFRTGAPGRKWRPGVRPAAFCEAFHAFALPLDDGTQFLHLTGEHLDLAAQCFQFRRPAPRSFRPRAESGRTVAGSHAVGEHLAAHFGKAFAVPIAGTIRAAAILTTGIGGTRRLGAAVAITTAFGTRRLRTTVAITTSIRWRRLGAATIITAGIRRRRLGTAAVFPAGIWRRRLRAAAIVTTGIRRRWLRAAVAIAAGLGILARPVTVAARLVLRLGIRGTRDTQGGEHWQEDWSLHEDDCNPDPRAELRENRYSADSPRRAE
jgi:hypothetical protein